MEDLEQAVADQDFLTATTKIRWQRMGMETGEVQRRKDENEIIEEEKIDEVIAMEERKFKMEAGSVSLQKKKYTSMKTNRRVLMPPSRPVKEECVIQARSEAWKSV